MGFKLFVLAGVSGFAYNFEIYSAQENDAVRSNGEPDLGATSNIVLRLSRIVPRSQNYKLYHDNYYTAIPLMVHLAKEVIYFLGTVRRYRLPNYKLPSEASMKNEERGKSIEYVTTVDNVDISSLIWKDNKYVTLISSFAGPSTVEQQIKAKTLKNFHLKKYDKISMATGPSLWNKVLQELSVTNVS